jgi:thiamine biosynthesis lipoprotein
VVAAAVDAARATGGLVDPLLNGRMVELGYDRTFDELGSEKRGGASPRPWHAGEWRAITLDPRRRTVRLPAGSGLDLGGIAKGMAVDAAMALLVGSGIAYGAVNAGGDLAVHGLPPGQDAWPIAIEGGDERMVTLRSGALATSSTLRRRWSVGGRERHHLLDPRTGFPAATGLTQASVASSTCRQSEAAAKAAILLGPVAAVDFLERHRLSALLVTTGGQELRIGPWT